MYHASLPADVSEPMSKADSGVDESAGKDGFASYTDAVAAQLSTSHRDYLLQRHGTLHLDPVPSMDPADPYNWPTWKVN